MQQEIQPSAVYTLTIKESKTGTLRIQVYLLSPIQQLKGKVLHQRKYSDRQIKGTTVSHLNRQWKLKSKFASSMMIQGALRIGFPFQESTLLQESRLLVNYLLNIFSAFLCLLTSVRPESWPESWRMQWQRQREFPSQLSRTTWGSSLQTQRLPRE